MKKEYDLSKMKSRKNPYAARLKKSVTMRLSEDVISYFKQMVEKSGVPLPKPHQPLFTGLHSAA